MKRSVKSLWKNFKSDLERLEKNFSAYKEEVDEEIYLAFEQQRHEIRQQPHIELMEAQTKRLQQRAEINESRIFLSQPKLALAKTKELQIQKLIKKEDRTRLRLRDQVLSSVNTRFQRKACRSRCHGFATCLFKVSELKEWIEEILPIRLWYLGTTRCGKTILIGHVVEQLKNR